MATFSDDFNRANGKLGAAWSNNLDSWDISGNIAVHGNSGLTYPAGANEPGNQYQALDIQSVGWWCQELRIHLKSSADMANRYEVQSRTWATNITYWVRRYDAGVATQLATGDYPVPENGWTRLEFSWVDGTLTFTAGGTVKWSGTDNTHASRSLFGISTNESNAQIDNYASGYVAPQAIEVSPDPLWVGGGDVAVTVIGEATTWTVGVPGSSTVTVDHGTITDQRTVSATEIRLTYTPAEYVGTITFTESQYGVSDSVDGTVVAPEGQGGGTTLSQDVIDWLEAQAAQGGLVLADSMENTEAGATFDLKTMLFDLHLGAYKDTATINDQAAASALLYLLYRNLSGYTPIAEPVFDLPTTDTPVKVDTEQTLQRLKDLTAVPAGDLTLSAMVDLLGGDPFASHHTLLEAIQATDSQAVLDAIAALQGAEGATVDGAIQLIQALSTVAGYDLSDVLTAISGVRGTGNPDLAAVMTKLGQVQPSTSYTLSSLNTQGVDLKQLLDTLALVIGIVAPEAGTVAELVALIYDAVTTAAPAAANVGPPVWIDEEHATIDSPIALSDGLIIEGPLDGVLVTITGSPSGATKFTFGETDSWRYVGAVIFETDRGDAEWSQPIGLEAQIITPRTMQHASAARFRVSSGWSGTVSAFTVTAGA